MVTHSDPRRELLQTWLARHFGTEAFTIATASADASFRRYFRIRAQDQSWIAMDAPPEREDCRPFVQVAALMRGAGINVPRVLAQDLERGFLLLSDLGSVSYLQALTDANAGELFNDAIDALLKLQRVSRPDWLPDYSEALIRRELDLFSEWYLGRHLDTTLMGDEREALARAVELIVASTLAQPRVLVHRDYMPRNLMVTEPNPGVLDFQDAVYGPISYDVVSLFRDAFISWEEERVHDWTSRYWEKARRAGLPVRADFRDFFREFEWVGLQRHLKVLGIFARIHYRDGKPGYLDDTPRFLRYALAVGRRYRELAPLASLIDRLSDRKALVGQVS